MVQDSLALIMSVQELAKGRECALYRTVCLAAGSTPGSKIPDAFLSPAAEFVRVCVRELWGPERWQSWWMGSWPNLANLYMS